MGTLDLIGYHRPGGLADGTVDLDAQLDEYNVFESLVLLSRSAG